VTRAFHIVVAMKPLEGNFAINALEHSVAGLNIDECRVGVAPCDPNHREMRHKRVHTTTFACDGVPRLDKVRTTGSQISNNGRFPANVVLDGSEEVVGEFPETVSGKATVGTGSGKQSGTYGQAHAIICSCFGDSGSASRFFKQFQGQSE